MSDSGLSEEVLEKIYDELNGTCASIHQKLSFYEIEADPEDVVSDLEEMGLEICPGCGWWVESWELIDDELNVVGCEQCR